MNEKIICKQLVERLAEITREINSTKVRYGLKPVVHRNWCDSLNSLVQDFKTMLEKEEQ